MSQVERFQVQSVLPTFQVLKTDNEDMVDHHKDIVNSSATNFHTSNSLRKALFPANQSTFHILVISQYLQYIVSWIKKNIN